VIERRPIKTKNVIWHEWTALQFQSSIAHHQDHPSPIIINHFFLYRKRDDRAKHHEDPTRLSPISDERNGFSATAAASAATFFEIVMAAAASSCE
jgi:hypothetical protein